MAPLALYVGSEAYGLPPAVRQTMECLVTVPMRVGVDSYSVNAVAAILLYEIRRAGWTRAADAEARRRLPGTGGKLPGSSDRGAGDP